MAGIRKGVFTKIQAMTYYNTNKESGDTLAKSRVKTKTQEDRIYEYFLTRVMTYDVAPHHLVDLFNDNTPITSIRRALTNLERAGILTKTDVMVEGSYGKMVHTWKLKNRQTELF